MVRLRPGPLQAAIALAVCFVLLRVAYRVVFGGVGGSGAVLIDLPLLRLGGPFSHVTLLGPITAQGLGNAAVSALPVAAAILVFGLLNAVVDVSRLFARGANRGPLRSVSRSLVIAWATFPALLESVRRVRIARRLRGERGAAALLVPVFEQTIERALALAASMETRGLAAGLPPTGDRERPVTMTNVSLSFNGPWRLEDLTLPLAPGTLTVISGPTGSGKSSLLHSLSGLFQHFSEGDQAGLIAVAGIDRAATPPRDTATFVGLVSQNVRLSFAAESVPDEIGFALTVRGDPPDSANARVLDVAAQLRITHLLPRPIVALSAGRSCCWSMNPSLTLTRRPGTACAPCSTISPTGRRSVSWSPSTTPPSLPPSQTPGSTFRAAESRSAPATIAPSTATMQMSPSPAPAQPGTRAPGHPETMHPETVPVTRDPVIDIRHLTVSQGDTRVVDDVSLSIRPGEIVALRGPNGAGKSSVLHTIALPTDAGTVRVSGADVHAQSRRKRRHLVALVPENFDDLLFATTVSEECRRADRGRRAATPTEIVFAGLLGRSDGPQLLALLGQHPRDLSAGERLCLVIAILLAAAPALLLVDEPTRGLDSQARALVGSALLRASGLGAAVMFATHDAEFAAAIATRTVLMRDARLAAELVPR